jgi:hypothetical protein
VYSNTPVASSLFDFVFMSVETSPVQLHPMLAITAAAMPEAPQNAPPPVSNLLAITAMPSAPQNPPVAKLPSSLPTFRRTSLAVAAAAATAVPTGNIEAEKMDAIMGDESDHLKRKVGVDDRLVDNKYSWDIWDTDGHDPEI